MLTSRLIAAAAVLVAFATARADSIIPQDFVDDFGVATVAAPQATSARADAAPFIPGNFVDDFGVAPSTTPAWYAAVPPPTSSIIPLNFVDDFGVTPQRPEGIATAPELSSQPHPRT